MYLYDVQHMYIGTIFSSVSPQLFQQRLAQIYEKVPDLSQRDTCLSYCQIMLVFAYGQLYSINQWTGHDGPPGFSYFTEAVRFLPDICEEGSLLFVEVLSLVGYFMQILNRRDTAFLYVGGLRPVYTSEHLTNHLDRARIPDGNITRATSRSIRAGFNG
jgi:proline utilization trans-activator